MYFSLGRVVQWGLV